MHTTECIFDERVYRPCDYALRFTLQVRKVFCLRRKNGNSMEEYDKTEVWYTKLANSTVANIRSIILSLDLHDPRGGSSHHPLFHCHFAYHPTSPEISRENMSNCEWCFSLSIFVTTNISTFLFWRCFKRAAKYIFADQRGANFLSPRNKCQTAIGYVSNVYPKMQQRTRRANQTVERICMDAPFNFVRRTFYSGKSLRVLSPLISVNLPVESAREEGNGEELESD